MMNVVAMILILTTITAGVWSPQAADKMNTKERSSRGVGDDVIVKEGHRVIVIEYEREEAPAAAKPNLQSSESPPPPSPPSSSSSSPSSPPSSSSSSSSASATQKPMEFEQNGISSVSSLVGNANEKFKEACTTIPNLGHGISGETLSEACQKTKEVMDEALDKASRLTEYKAHLIEQGAKGVKNTAVETGKKVSDKAHDFKEAFEDARDKVLSDKTHGFIRSSATENFNKVKEKVREKTQWEEEAAEQVRDVVKEKTHDLKEAVEGAAESVTEKAKRIPLVSGKAKWRSLDKAHDLKEAVGETGRRVAETFSEAKDKVKEKFEDAAEMTKKRVPEAVSNAKETVSEKARDLKGATEDAAGVVKEKTHEMKEAIEEAAIEAPKKVSEGFSKAKETAKRMPENVGMAKEKVLEKGHEFKEAIEDTVEATPEKVSEGFDTAKETMKRVPEGIDMASEKVLEKAHELKDVVEEGVTEAPRKISERLSNVKDKVVDKAQELKGGSKASKETATERVKRIANMLRRSFTTAKMAVTDDRTKHQKTTHFLIEGNRNFTDVFWKSWVSVTGASDETVNLVVGAFRMIGFCTAYGGCVWVTFVSSHMLKKALPRQQYAMVQSKIYPIYFRVLAYGLGVAILGHLVTKHHHKSSPSEKFHGLDLMTAFGFVLINLLFLEPRATKVMLEKMKWEKEEGRGVAGEPSSGGGTEGSRTAEEITAQGLGRTEAEEDRGKHRAELERLNKRLQTLNTSSAFFNILTLMTLTFHLVFLSECLYVTC